jgi:predicted RNA-binding protein associated with RNAse of E/G family
VIIPLERVRGELTFDFIRPPDRRISMRTLLLEATEEDIVVAHESSPSKPVEFFGERVFDAGYWAVWFVFKHRPFDVGLCYRPDGTFTGYYVDILEPVLWTGANPATLEPIVDLFLDLWIAPDGRYLVLDEDEFQEAIDLGSLTTSQITHARRALQDVIEATERGAFPPAVVRDFQI